MKIFNWIVGSFCRTLGRFLFYIAIGLLVMLIISGKVNAQVVTDINNIKQFTYVDIVDLNSNGIGTTKGANIDTFTTSTDTTNYDLSFFYNASSMTLATYGVGLELVMDNYFFAGRTYTLCLQIGKEFSNEIIFKSNLLGNAGGVGTDTFSAYNQQFRYVYNIGSLPTEFLGNYSYNQLMCYTFTTQSNGNHLFLPIGVNGSVSVPAGHFALYGYYLHDYGSLTNLSTSDIQNVINSSGLATASSVQELNASVSAVQQEVRELNTSIDVQTQQQQQNHQETMNTITSTESADLGALQNSAGWLPAGPIDSILNLPLSLLNNLTTNLNKSCQPVILPIPYVNKDLILPCVNTLYDDMGISGWVTTIGVIASAFIMFSYLLKLYRWVDDTLSFRENNQIDNWGGI